MPYGFRRLKLIDTELVPGKTLFFVGDQAEVIPSLTGDGMSLALRSAEVAAKEIELIVRGNAHSRIIAPQQKPSMQMWAARSIQSLFELPMLTAKLVSLVSLIPSRIKDALIRALFSLTRAPIQE